MEKLRMMYDQNIDYSLRYLIAVEKKLRSDFPDVELPIEDDATLIAEMLGKLVKYEFDKVRFTTFKMFDGGFVELHACKENGKKCDLWVHSEKVFGNRLDLVYNKIIWEEEK